VAQARAAKEAYLYRPATAVRVRFGTNDPTPWPPELPAGENPPPGGIIDYYLAGDAKGPVTLDIVSAAGKVIRSYSSDDSVRGPQPALDPKAYDELCQQDPSAPHCNLPFYWPAPPMTISTRAGMHRVSWDLRYQPITAGEDEGEDEGSATGAVPHHTYPAAQAPWAPPGRYTVRLRVNGKRYEQPLVLRLDPRVKTPAAGLATLASLSKEMYDGAAAAHAAWVRARALSAALDSLRGAEVEAFKARVDSIAPAPSHDERPPFRRRGTERPATLDAASEAMLAAAMAMQSADVTPTAAQVAACDRARADGRAVMARWTALESTGLAALNAKRKAAGEPAVVVPGGEHR
jgi:hypothetical protein